MTPQEKKQLELDYDRRYAVEYPKAFRKQWSAEEGPPQPRGTGARATK